MTPLAAALDYAARGWPVFPCKPHSKVPVTWHGFHDATTDPDVIRQWWRQMPAANVAIATGAPAVDVLDVDVKDAGNGYAAFNRLKRAGLLTGALAIVRTPSGGLHAYFAGTGQRCGALKRHFLDFKATGGYVLAPPSTVGGRAYELLDRRDASGVLDWARVTRFLDPPAPRPQQRVRAHRPQGRLPRWLLDRLADTNVPDRSAHFHGTVCACRRLGLNEEQTTELLTPWCEAVGKYVGRVAAEVARSWKKVDAA